MIITLITGKVNIFFVYAYICLDVWKKLITLKEIVDVVLGYGILTQKQVFRIIIRLFEIA